MNRICYMAVWCYCQLTCFRNRNKKAMFCHGIVIKRNVFKNLKSRDKALKMDAISIVAERVEY